MEKLILWLKCLENSDEYFAHIVDVYRIQSQVYPQTIVLW